MGTCISTLSRSFSTLHYRCCKKMSCFFAVAVVPWMLCAVMSQAYPMAVTPGTQGQTQSTPAPETLPAQPHESSPKLNPSPTEGQTVSASAPVNVNVIVRPEHGHCPPNTVAVPCPHQCQCKCPVNDENKPTGENTETDQKKKTGVWHGLKKLALLCANTLYEAIAGENGILTNLPDKVACGPPPPPKKPPKKKQNKNSGDVRACCIFGSAGPAVLGDESEEEEEPAKNTKTLQLPPVTLSYIHNQISALGQPAPAAAQVPAVKGPKHKTTNVHFNGCCIGKRLFNFSKLFKWKFIPQINICAGAANVNVVEIN
ncbi:uncharacterized protein LOC135833896 [Planococcus citri]|uniref:uncharacterized protein LOC135833896 n=1 Tax=Planococcus citri TaxID=170843 RepID=UPI0031F7E2B1